MLKKSDLIELIAFQKSKIEATDLGQIRHLLHELNQNPGQFALIISGIRRCGKSTLLNQYVSENVKESYIYLNFDSAKLYTFEIADFQLLDEIIKENGSKWLIFDEIQIIEGWELYVRQKLDEGFLVLITGSNASLLSRELGTKLTGRHITKELFPFSFQEFCSFKNLELNEQSFSRFLQLGGFPGYLKEENNDIHTALLDDILYRDIAVRHNIRDVKSLKHLLLFLASNCSKPISANKLKQYLGIKSTATVLEYLHFFEESYLIQLIPKFSYSQKVQLVNPRKIYFIDNGLQQAVTNSFSKDVGRKLENTVFWELRRKGKELYYFNENGKECDFVICKKDQVEHVIQVCHYLNLENEQREINGLLEAMNFFELKSGTIITLNQEDVVYSENKRIEIVSAYNYFGNTES
jgi:predicted AAA+ superfamily ATPase